MASNPNRKITDEQFVEGSTIDGTRIEKALDDTYDKLNNVPKQNLKQMFVPRTYFCGWQAGHFSPNYETPDEASYQNHFMPLYNSFTRDVVGNTGARTAVNNEWRWKGTQIKKGNGLIPAQPAGGELMPNYNYSDVVGKTFSFYLEKPSIITDLAIIWERDYYTGLYKEQSTENPTTVEFASAGLFWWGELLLDSIFNADDKRKASVLWRRTMTQTTTDETFNALPQSDFLAKGMIPRNPATALNWITDRSNRIPNVDFQPNDYQSAIVPANNAVSNHPVYQTWWEKNLNILVPQQSRLHFGFGCAINRENFSPPIAPIQNYGNFDPYKFDTKFHLGYRYNLAVSFLEIVEK